MDTTMIPGWRKLSAWVLVYAFVVYMTYAQKPVGDNEVELIWRLSLLFFGGNSLEWVAKMIQSWKGK